MLKMGEGGQTPQETSRKKLKLKSKSTIPVSSRSSEAKDDNDAKAKVNEHFIRVHEANGGAERKLYLQEASFYKKLTSSSPKNYQYIELAYDTYARIFFDKVCF